jgi:hypothetical protein
MKRETILIGRGREITTIPRKEWEQELETVPQYFKDRLSFMTTEHHRVRYCVVRELPLKGEPLSIEFITTQTHLSADQVTEILDDLERHLMYLYRNHRGTLSACPRFFTLAVRRRKELV